MIQVVSCLSLIFLILNSQLIACISLDPSIDTRFWKSNSSTRIAPAKNLEHQFKNAKPTEVPEIVTSGAISTVSTVDFSYTAGYFLASGISASSVTVSTVPDPDPMTNTPPRPPKPQNLSTLTLLFILAIILFMLVLIGWLVCQFLVKEREQKERTGPMRRDTLVNTISSAQSDTKEEPQTLRSELLVKSPMRRVKAGDDESLRTQSRVQMSKSAIGLSAKRSSKENIYSSSRAIPSNRTTASTGFQSNQILLQSDMGSSTSSQASMQINQAPTTSERALSPSRQTSIASTNPSLVSPASVRASSPSSEALGGSGSSRAAGASTGSGVSRASAVSGGASQSPTTVSDNYQ